MLKLILNNDEITQVLTGPTVDDNAFSKSVGDLQVI